MVVRVLKCSLPIIGFQNLDPHLTLGSSSNVSPDLRVIKIKKTMFALIFGCVCLCVCVVSMATFWVVKSESGTLDGLLRLLIS